MQVDAALAELDRRRGGRHLLLLFDFDGTLAPFNADPAAVYLDNDLRDALTRLQRQSGTTLGIISGRRLADLSPRIGLEVPVYLAGFHGLEIHSPDGGSFVHPGAASAVTVVTAIAAAIRPQLAALPGVFVEDKHYSIALHYREAAPAVGVVAVSRFMDAARADLDAGRVRLLPGASVVELLPAVEWHKGRALQWIRDRVESAHGSVFTVYVGDDVTDEDAFRALGPDGLALSASDRAAGGHFRVDGPAGVKRLLDSLDGSKDNRRA
jgi:trehalose-phosphatase